MGSGGQGVKALEGVGLKGPIGSKGRPPGHQGVRGLATGFQGVKGVGLQVTMGFRGWLQGSKG